MRKRMAHHACRAGATQRTLPGAHAILGRHPAHCLRSCQGPLMSATATCPRCATQFDGRKALLWGGVAPFYSPFSRRTVALKVRCPYCHHVFATPDIELFGFLSPNGYRVVVIGILVVCVVLAKYLPH